MIKIQNSVSILDLLAHPADTQQHNRPIGVVFERIFSLLLALLWALPTTEKNIWLFKFLAWLFTWILKKSTFSVIWTRCCACQIITLNDKNISVVWTVSLSSSSFIVVVPVSKWINVHAKCWDIHHTVFIKGDVSISAKFRTKGCLLVNLFHCISHVIKKTRHEGNNSSLFWGGSYNPKYTPRLAKVNFCGQ